ncbi:MAG: bifunctional histidinol-phosphatase/imidazoleglycerol-phosphate dehydratase HisB [Candidatus Wenzhouxiangella sp. M2_3B_020]
MSLRKILFIDRDGCLIEEPADEQIDAFEKLRLVPGVIPALLRLRDDGYRFVLVSNQDGLGTESFPTERFEGPHRLLMQVLASQGIEFDAEHIDASFPHENKPTRKPGIGMLMDYVRDPALDRDRSAVIGDRETDMELADNLGIRGLRVGPEGMSWKRIADDLLERPRTATVERRTNETRIGVDVNLDAREPVRNATGIGFFDHMLDQLAAHGGFSLELECEGDLHIDEHHTVEDCALALGEALDRALGDRRGIGRYGFVLPMDESLAHVAIDLSGRPVFELDGAFPRDSIGGLHTEMVRHFFASLAQALRCAIHLEVTGENTHHMVEACFKGVGRALRPALAKGEGGTPSTKGVL